MKILGTIGRKDRKFRRVEHIPQDMTLRDTIEDTDHRTGTKYYRMFLWPHEDDTIQQRRVGVVKETRIVHREVKDYGLPIMC